MAITYDTLGSTVTIDPSGFIPANGLNTAVAIVGGYDSANADSGVFTNEVTTVTETSEAQTKFGTDSELARQSGLAIANGAGRVDGIPIETTSDVESFSSAASGTLSNVPIADPRVHPSMDVTAVDGNGDTIDVVMADEASPATPSGDSTIALNPMNGEWRADSTGSYDISYRYGDYSTAIQTAVSQDVRYVIVCTENDGVKATLTTHLKEEAGDFRFMRGIVGASVGIDSGGVSSYSPSSNSWRLIEVAPSRGQTANDGDAYGGKYGGDAYGGVRTRTLGAIGGLLAQQPINVEGSITYDEVIGLTELNVSYAPTKAETFEMVTALTRDFEVAEGVTTSTEPTFADIYAGEIIDLAVEQLYGRVKEYKGGSNTQTAQRRFRARLKRLLASYTSPDATPPLLATGEGGRPYSVAVSNGSSDTETDVKIGMEPAPIAKEVYLDISVGPLRFNGVST